MTNQIVQNFIDGRFTEGSLGRTFEDRAPVDGSLVALVHEAGSDEVDAAVTAARRALAGPWGALAAEDRAKLLHKVADGIDARFDEFLAAEIADTGKPRSIAAHIDIPRGAANFRVFADLVKNIATESFGMATPDGAGAVNYAHRIPKGVIAVICPWNLPLLLMTWKVGPALAAGNTVVVKPSEETPVTATLLGEVMNDAGIPPGVYNVVHGFGPNSAGEHLTRNTGIDAITFTGETVTGAEIMKQAAVGLRDVSFECGGKNPALIFADCDFDEMIEGMARAVFANCGQVCLNTERVYVERSIFDRFVDALKDKAEGFQRGDPMDPATTMGPLISQEHRDKVLSYYGKAVDAGAEVITGGGVPDMPGGYAEGSWIEPTIWTGLDESAAAVREEIFGPCCHVRPFDDEDEAIALANDSPYGLATSIWTSDLSRGNRVAQRVEAGITWVNCWFLRDLRTPFGGSKQSGIGREGGVHSLEFYTELRNICVKL
ncbi:MAG: 2-hydroxymuconic semialdehyde dehydrogenase [Alphaproteobacteria bacterium]|nr:2-hydroxymuconic semialdehyde dehydrogenase [Alphaproteobacteria bacterium]